MTETKLSLLPDPPAQGVPSAYFGYAGWVTEMAMRADDAAMLAECIERDFIDADSTMLNSLSILGYCDQRKRVKCAAMLRKRGWK